ncbi:hypothetical protein CK203_103402 [Vitis vinifera]|uniref:Uncharacterized protein n=1 Tax=Vitis vinifera TaxID=29760 RepID=A0A438EJ51_VITVI|nr:hypothetical protein CK203_103402 [Vitis vinifera]
MKASVCKRSQGYNVIMQRKGVEKMFWNVRGVNNEEKRKVIKSMIHSQNVYLACLWLNKGGSYLDGLGQKLRVGKFLEWSALEATGAAGGVVGFIALWTGENLKMLGSNWGSIRRLWEGGSFIWCGGLNRKSMSRIDHFLIMADWEDHFTNTSQFPLLRLVSDYSSILIQGGGIKKGRTPFRFENMWLKLEGFKDVVKGGGKGINLVDPRASFWLQS